MKKLICILPLLVVSIFIFTSAEAQRDARRGSEDKEKRSSQQRNELNNSSERGNRNTISRTGNFREHERTNYNRATVDQQYRRPNSVNSTGSINSTQQRNEVALLENRNRRNNSVTQQRVYTRNDYGSERHVTRNVYNRYSSYNNYYSRGGYYPRLYPGGHRYTILPRNSITINFGGSPYYYNDGFFYGSYGGYYQPLFPPPGISIRILPFGYRRIFIGANLFYYYNGIYYRNRDKNNYEVVDAPMGATVSSLPKGAKSVVLNGEKLYELNGTYYKEDRNYKGETVYTVVGKNGEVSNTSNSEDNDLLPEVLNNGDVINQLPEGAKIVTINGEKLYVTPDDTYLKEESDGDIVRYKVVGK